MDNINEQELYHHGVKGQKWGIIKKRDDQDHRLAAEKERLKYDYKNREAEMFYKNQSEKDRMDYKRDLKLAKIEKSIETGKRITEKAISRNERLSEKYKYNAQSIKYIALALAGSSIGRNIADVSQGKGIGNKYVTTKIDNRSNYSENKSKTYSIDNSLTKIKSVNKVGKNSNQAIKYPEFIHSDLDNVLVSDLKDISHSGIFGMKWGVRRFQNKDGSLTEEGKLRYYGKDNYRKQLLSMAEKSALQGVKSDPNWSKFSKEEKEEKIKTAKERATEAAEKVFEDTQKNLRDTLMDDKEVITTVETGRQVLDNTKNIFYQTKDLIPNVPGQNLHPDYTDISTEELKRRTDRLNTEANYARAAGEMKYIPSKQEVTRNRLQNISTVFGILATVGNVVLSVEKFKHDNNLKVGGKD